MELNNYFVPLVLRHLQLMGIKCDPKELQLVLQSAPSFPSILSIVQACTYFGLKATAYRADYTALTKATTPAIAHIKEDSTDRFILVYIVSETEVTYYDAFLNKEIKISKDDFCTLWDGIIVLSEKTENNIFHKPVSRVTEYGIVLATLCFVFGMFVINPLPLQSFLFFSTLLGLKIAGIWFTVGLLMQESKGVYSVFDTFCHVGDAFDCTKVVESKVSKLFNNVALADIGFVYFSMGIILLCIAPFSGIMIPVLQLLFYLSVCSTPFILFSIFYQKIVVKKWCPLCLGTMLTLIFEVILFLFFPTKIFSGDLVPVVRMLFFSCFISIGVLFLMKRIVENQAKVFNTSKSVLQLKRTPLITSAVFSGQKNISQQLSDSLTIGYVEAPVTITTLLNPICNPCKNIAVEIIRLLETYPSFIQWHIRLDGMVTHEYDNLNKPQLYLFDLFRQNDSTKVRLNIIKEWFKTQSIRKLSEIYPPDNIPEETILLFSEHLRNNDKLKAEKVPSIWINNRVFPKEYSLRDIPFLLTDLGILLKSTI